MEYRTFRLEPIVHTIAVATASTFAIKLHDALKEQGLVSYLVWALVLPVAAVVYGALDVLFLRFPLRVRSFRQLLSRIASIEGYWFEGVHSSDNPFSVVCIEYDPMTNSYIYHGYNYNSDGTCNASFRSVQTSVSDSGSGITFNFEATVHVWSEEKGHLGSNAAKGYGVITFFGEGSRGFVRGEGEFFERNPNPNWRTFELYKISEQDLQEILGQCHASDDLDYERIVHHFDNKRRKKRRELSSVVSELSEKPPKQVEKGSAETRAMTE